MSKFKKPKSELTPLDSRLLYKSFSSTLFHDLSCDELNKLSDSGLPLKFSKGSQIGKRNEPIIWFGILLSGELLLSINDDTLGTLQSGSLIGGLAVLDYKPSSQYQYDITGNSEGVISCFLIEDLSNIHRKIPKIAIKFIELIGKQTLNFASYNLNAKFLFASNFIEYTEYSVRRKQEFAALHPVIASSDLDKIDLKVLASVFKVVHFKAGTWITRKGTVENSVFFVFSGRCGDFDSREFEENVFGAEYFLEPGREWESSVVGTGDGILLWMRLEDFNDIVLKQAASCVKFVKLLSYLVASKIFDRKTEKLAISVKTDQNFLELDPSQLTPSQKLSEIQEESDKEYQEEFPLYTFPMYEDLLPEPLPIPAEAAPELLFPLDRLKKQQIELKSKRKGKPSPSPPRAKRDPLKKEISSEISDLIKDLVLDIKKIEEENQKLEEEIEKLNEENYTIQQNIEDENLQVESKEVKIKKARVMKDIEKIQQSKDFNLNQAPNFKQITQGQVSASRSFYLAWKYAEKWKEFVKLCRIKKAYLQ